MTSLSGENLGVKTVWEYDTPVTFGCTANIPGPVFFPKRVSCISLDAWMSQVVGLYFFAPSAIAHESGRNAS